MFSKFSNVYKQKKNRVGQKVEDINNTKRKCVHV